MQSSSATSSNQIPGFDDGCVVRAGVIYLPSGLEAAIQKPRTSNPHVSNWAREPFVFLPRKGRMWPVRVVQAIALATIPNPECRPRAEKQADGTIAWAGQPKRQRKEAVRRPFKFVSRVDWAAETRARQ